MNNHHHFLDTNIILAMVLDNDSCFDDVKNYLEFNSIHYISNTAKEEAKFKINTDKRIFLELAEYIKNFSNENNVDLLKFNKSLNYIKKSFLKQYDEMDFPENMPKKRFQSLVESFFDRFENEIINIVIDFDNSHFKQHIIGANISALSNLEVFSKKHNCISFVQSGNLVPSLKEIGIANKDAILIDESHHLSLTLNDSVNFITFDHEVQQLKDRIIEEITKNVVVSSPMEFVSFNN